MFVLRAKVKIADDGCDELEVPPRRDFGNDAAEPGVQLGL